MMVQVQMVMSPQIMSMPVQSHQDGVNSPLVAASQGFLPYSRPSFNIVTPPEVRSVPPFPGSGQGLTPGPKPGTRDPCVQLNFLEEQQRA